MTKIVTLRAEFLAISNPTLVVKVRFPRGFTENQYANTDIMSYELTTYTIARMILNPDHNCIARPRCLSSERCSFTGLLQPANPEHREPYYQIVRNLILAGRYEEELSFTYE